METKGLNLFSSFTRGEFLPLVGEQLEEQGLDLEAYQSLLLFGHAGSAIWSGLDSSDIQSNHPIDQYSAETARDFFRNYLNISDYLIVYPGNFLFSLQKLGHSAGWGRPSILGLDISSRYGTWYAYRIVALVKKAFPAKGDRPIATDVCAECAKKPCIPACPASVISMEGFDLNACIDQRVSENSPCATACLSRLACPIGQPFRYVREQLDYFGMRSLRSIKKYRNIK